MSKELTPIEALNKVKSLLFYEMDEKNFGTECDIIETALKRLEKIETTTHSVLRDDISKKLKAFEIIKAKPQTLDLIKTYENYDAYLELAHDIALIEDIYSPEEFELLREVML